MIRKILPAIFVAGFLVMAHVPQALAASKFQATVTLLPSGGVSISWSDPGTPMVGGLYVTITGSDKFTDQAQFTAGRVTDPNGQAGTTYTVAENDYAMGQQYASVNVSANGNSTGAQQNQDLYEIFTPARWAVAMTWYYTLTGLSGIFIFFVIIRSGYRYIHSSMNPGIRADFMADIQRCFAAMGIVVFAPLFVYVLIGINNGFVSLFAHIASAISSGDNVSVPHAFNHTSIFENVIAAPFQVLVNLFNYVFGLQPLDKLIFNGVSLGSFGTGSIFMGNFHTGNALADVILNMSMVGFDVYFNALYTIRRWTVIATLVSTPLIVWVWVLTEEKQVLEIWAAELVSTIFIQLFHALSLGIFYSVLNASILVAHVLSGVGINSLVAGLKSIGVWVASLGGAMTLFSLVIVTYRLILTPDEKRRSEIKQGMGRAIIGMGILGLSLMLAGFMVFLLDDPVGNLIQTIKISLGSPSSSGGVTVWEAFFMLLCVIPIAKMFSTIFMKLVVRVGTVNQERLAGMGVGALGGIGGLLMMGRTMGMAMGGKRFPGKAGMPPGFSGGGASPPRPSSGPPSGGSAGGGGSTPPDIFGPHLIGTPIEPSGVKAPSGGPTASPGDRTSTGGWRPTPSGLLVSGTPGAMRPGSFSPLELQPGDPRSLDQVVASNGEHSDRAAKAGGMVGALGGFAVPEALPAITAMTAGLAKAVSNPALTAWHTGKNLQKLVKLHNGNVGEALKVFTGEDTAGRAAAKVAGSVAFSLAGSKAAGFGGRMAVGAVNLSQKAYGKVDSLVSWK